MKFKLRKEHLKILETYLKSDCPDLFNRMNASIQSSVFDMNDDDVVELHDWLGEKFQLIGLDKRDEVTSEGKILEDILDIVSD